MGQHGLPAKFALDEGNEHAAAIKQNDVIVGLLDLNIYWITGKIVCWHQMVLRQDKYLRNLVEKTFALSIKGLTRLYHGVQNVSFS